MLRLPEASFFMSCYARHVRIDNQVTKGIIGVTDRYSTPSLSYLLTSEAEGALNIRLQTGN